MPIGVCCFADFVEHSSKALNPGGSVNTISIRNGEGTC